MIAFEAEAKRGGIWRLGGANKCKEKRQSQLAYVTLLESGRKSNYLIPMRLTRRASDIRIGDQALGVVVCISYCHFW